MESEKLATELLHEVKAHAKRWFIAFMIVLVLWFATIGVFIWYISLPTETSTVIEQESDDGSLNQVIGGDYNGIKTEGD